MELNDTKNKVAEFLSKNYKAYDIPKICEKLGLEPGDISEPYLNKKKYVLRRVKSFDEKQMIDLINKIELETKQNI